MAKVLINDTTLQSMANAIRSKTGSSEQLKPSDMVTEIGSIIKPSGTIDIAENGLTDVTNYANANVNVSSEVNYNATIDGSKGNYAYLCLTEIDKVDISNNRNASHFFSSLNNLERINTYNHNPSLTNLYDWFNGCEKLEAIPFFDTSNNTSMSGMFYGCREITSIPNFDTTNVTNFGNCCRECVKLKNFNGNWNLSKGTNFSGMFQQCSNLETVTLNSMDAVQSMEDMFYYCSNLKTVNFTNTANATNMKALFRDCSNLESVTNLSTSHVTDFTNLFASCYKLKDMPAFDLSSVTSIGRLAYMFYGCTSLSDASIYNLVETLKTFPTTSSSTKRLSQVNVHMSIAPKVVAQSNWADLQALGWINDL